MHNAHNMVGECKANYNVPLWKRYVRMSKHSKPGWFKKTLVGLVTVLEVKLGVTVYA